MKKAIFVFLLRKHRRNGSATNCVGRLRVRYGRCCHISIGLNVAAAAAIPHLYYCYKRSMSSIYRPTENVANMNYARILSSTVRSVELKCVHLRSR